MNGATEQTLSELLAEARRTNVNIANLTNLMARMNTGGGGGGGLGGAASTAASAMVGLATRINPVGIALSALSAAGSLVSGVFEGLSSIIGKTTEVVGGVISGLVQFSKKAMDGTAKMSDLFASFERLPFFIGEVAGFFASLLRTGEQYLEVYRNLVKVGADFGGNLFQIRTQASRAHLTLGEFANVVNKNSDIFASMGGNVQSGINKFVELQNGLMRGSFRNQILGLGYSFEEAANATMGYIRSQGTMAKQGLENNSMVRQGVVQYAMELDALSKTTGKQRDQIAKELQDLQMEEVWQNFVSQLSPDKAAAARAAVSAQLQYGGKEAARSLQLAFQGINVPINDATSAIEVATNGMLTTTNQQVVNAVHSGRSSNDMLVMVAQNNAAMGRSARAFQNSMGGIAGVLSQQSSPLVLATGQMTLTARNINDILRALGIAQSSATRQSTSQAAAVAEAEYKVRKLGEALNEAWILFVSRLSPSVMSLGNSILGLVEKLVGNKGFRETMNSVLAAFNDLVSSSSLKEFWVKIRWHLSNGFDAMWEWAKPVWENTVKPAAINMYNSIVDFLAPFMRKAFNFVFERVNEYVYKTSYGKIGTDPKEYKEINKEKEYYDSARDQVARLTRRLKELDGRDARDKVELSKVWADLFTAKERVQKIFEAIKSGEEIPGFSRDPELKMWERSGSSKIQTSTGMRMMGELGQYLIENPPVQDQRSLGTLGALGSPTEPKDVVAQLHQGERVLSQGEVGSLNNMGESLQRLNSLTAQSVIETKENNRHSRDILAAIKALGGNLYA